MILWVVPELQAELLVSFLIEHHFHLKEKIANKLQFIQTKGEKLTFTNDNLQ